jgi:alkylated DNA repair dioxygenase AlkB
VDELAYVDRDVPVERVELDEGSWVDVVRGWLPEADAVAAALLVEVPWQASRLFRYDHEVEERRLGSAWQAGTPLPHPALAEATRVLQHRYKVRFGGFGMIQYRDGTDGQAFHRDTDMRWLEDTVVAILSLGAVPRRRVRGRSPGLDPVASGPQGRPPLPGTRLPRPAPPQTRALINRRALVGSRRWRWSPSARWRCG